MPPITLPRRTLHSFRTVLKKHLGLKARDDGPPVRIDAGAQGGTRLTSVGPRRSRREPADPPAPARRPGWFCRTPCWPTPAPRRAATCCLSESDGGDAVVANWDERGCAS